MSLRLVLAVLLTQAFLLPAVASHSRFPRPIHQTEGRPVDLASADLNLDGNIDLVVLSQSPAEILVHLGRDNGILEDALHFPVAEQPQEIDVGDFNGDGRPDVVVAGWFPSVLTVLAGDPATLLQPGVSFATGIRPASIVIHDFNHDGLDDLVVAANFTTPEGLLLYLGNAEAILDLPIALSTGNLPLTAAVGDFNSDEEADLIVGGIGAGPEPHSITVLEGNGDGTFAPPVPVPEVFLGQTHRIVVVEDYNDDGNDDFAMTSKPFIFGGSVLVIYLGDGSNGFEAVESIGDYVFHPPQAGDLDLDGIIDLLVINLPFGVEFFKGTGHGTFNRSEAGPFLELALLEPNVPRHQPTAIDLADFNNDGQPDPVQAIFTDSFTHQWGEYWILPNNGNGTYGTGPAALVGSRPNDAATGDFNADGHTDLAVADPRSGDVSVLFGNGDGTFQPELRLPRSGKGVLATDLNQDGWDDILGTGRLFVRAFLSDGAGGFLAIQSPIEDDFGTLAIGARSSVVLDFNDDGMLDLLFSYMHSEPYDNRFSRLYWMPGNGDGSFDTAAFLPEAGQAGTQHTPRVAGGDFNRDGCGDVAMAAEIGLDFFPPVEECLGSNPCSLLIVVAGACDGSVQSRTNYVSSVGFPFVLHAADVDESGTPDLIVSGQGTEIFLGDDQGGFALRTTLPRLSVPVQVADYDADGHLDLTDGSDFHFGDGTGAFSGVEHYKQLGAWATADFNSDDRIDFIQLTSATPDCPDLSDCPGAVWFVPNLSEPPAREVSIDIRPGSEENVINLASYGVIPVAILSSDDFDAPGEIDPGTVRLSGSAARTVGKTQEPLCHAVDINADNLPDLLCQILTQDLDLTPEDTVAVLKAQTFDGSPVRGEDHITVRRN